MWYTRNYCNVICPLYPNQKAEINRNKTKLLRKAVYDLAPTQETSQALGGGIETAREGRPIE